MSKFNKKTRIIIIIIITIVIGLIYSFISRKEKSQILNNLSLEELSIQEDTETNENTNDKEEKNKIMVHIAGAVNKEGIYELQEGERIADIIEKAEGLTKEANLDNINLAYKLEDGMKIYIPKISEENNTNTYGENKVEQYNIKENTIKKEEKSANYNKEEKVNINTSTQTELETLPGIGTSTALKIIEYRKTKGKFKKVEDIKNVNGIGESKYEKIKNLIKI